MSEPQPKVTIELKNTKVSAHLSQETIAFTSSVYVNNIRAFTVRNDGNGGSNRYDILGQPGSPTRKRNTELYKQAEQHAMNTFNAHQVYEHLDILINQLLSEAESNKELKGWCRNKIILKLPNTPEGEYLQIQRNYTPSLKTAILEKYPGAEIINERFTPKTT